MYCFVEKNTRKGPPFAWLNLTGDTVGISNSPAFLLFRQTPVFEHDFVIAK